MPFASTSRRGSQTTFGCTALVLPWHLSGSAKQRLELNEHQHISTESPACVASRAMGKEQCCVLNPD